VVLELREEVGAAGQQLGPGTMPGENRQACIDAVRCCELETSL
jgi:hypothetical protein